MLPRISANLCISSMTVASLVCTFAADPAIAACTAGHPNASVAESTPTADFTDHGNGTVTHKPTGLMWKKCVQGMSGAACATGTASTLTWSAALQDSVGDRAGNHGDWRVPNKLELASIVELCGWGPAINQTVFPATPAAPGAFTYTSTSDPGPTRAAGIAFLDGFPFILDKTFPQYIRLVRGGRTPDRFDAQPSLLSVTMRGSGSGSVGSNPAGISCGATCSQAFGAGATVTLTPTPAAGSIFSGWLGACTGRGACTVGIRAATAVSATFAPDTTLLRADVDGNGDYDALTDGLLILRYLFGLTGDSLTSHAIGNAPTRSTPAGIILYLDDIKPILDVDGNGQVDALTDGLMTLRYLFGLRGPALVAGAVGDGATRKTDLQIEPYIASILP